MSPEKIELIGYMAATLTTLSFLPQAIKTIKTRHAKDLSLGMYATFTIGVICWGIYGIFLQSTPIIVANAVTVILSGTILFLKIKNG